MNEQTMAAAVATRQAQRTDQARAGLAGMAAGPFFACTAAAVTWLEWGYLRATGWRLGAGGEIPYPSYTATGRYGLVQVLNFTITGILLLVFARGLAPELGRGARGLAARVSLFALGAAVLASACKTDLWSGHGSYQETSWHGLVHGVAFILLLLTSTVGSVLVGLALRRNPRWRTESSLSLATGPLLVLAMAGVPRVVDGEYDFFAFLALLFGWVFVLGHRLRRLASDPA